MMKRILFLVVLLTHCDPLYADPLDSWSTWVTAQPTTAKQIPPAALVARGVGTDTYYVLEVDETTGEIPVSIATGISVDYSGATGAAVPADAAFVGGTDGTNLRGIKVDSSGELQVDVLTLPATAATTTKQDEQTALLTTIDADTGSIDTKTPALGQAAMAASTPVVIASDQSAVPISNLPTTVDTNSGAAGASTPRSVLATRHEAAATPLSVRISNGSAFSTPAPAGRTYADSARNVYSSTNVTTAAWVELIASTAADINELHIFDSCGQTLELGTGAAAAETRKLIIPPGGPDGPISLYIPSGTRVAIKAISATCSVGELDITGLN